MISIEEIHPLLVHFPIVLFLLAVLVDFLVLLRKGDLATAACLPTAGFYLLLLAAIAAVVTATFGDIALDKAIQLGFDQAPLDEHQDLGLATLWIMLGLATWQSFARWRDKALNAGKGWLFFAVTLVGVGVLLDAAYHGGQLVYSLGVNVAPVHPLPMQ